MEKGRGKGKDGEHKEYPGAKNISMLQTSSQIVMNILYSITHQASMRSLQGAAE